ncbi:kinase-like protein [Hyaloscypha bicolor E]|uniref:Kinase-like protein n=1 Tax=Hyaloscypha bicolor E TaxID=1095630 RepID=A0A2J6TWT3_9HELO|nr:kinase-like protein [Hyaloscypha bicolor E]PMD67465.1 kinase-like protein [Hyaloscypha bicolor E]
MAGGSVPSDSYDEVSTHIYCQLSRNLLPDEEHSLRFAPRGIAEQVLHDENLGSVFRSLSLSPTDWPDDFNENVFVQKIKDKKLHNVLAIILYASCNITAAQAFISKLVIGDGSSNLPLSRDACLELFDGSHAQTRKYRDAQPIFCTVVIGDPHSLKIQDLKEWRLPYLEPTYIGDGSFGEVYAVKIAAGHLVTKTQDGQSFYDEIPVARKDYLLNPKRYGESEYNIINAILTSRFNCKNIVESFGSIEVVNDTKPRYSLFMPLAKCDLQKYMEEKGPERLKTVVEKSSILWSAVGLTEGLEFLHYKMSTTVDRKNFACYHMDLKPANILLFEDGDRMIWKLSDFGMSRVKFLNEDEQDFEQPFLKRNQSLSKTKNLRAEGTYLAPETQASTKTSGRESDVWSLGAIISTLFTYMEEGRDGLEKYTSARNEYKGSKGYDYFFLTSDSKRFEKARRHPAVAEWHAKLVKKAKKRDPNEAKIVQHLLGYIDNSVLVLNPESRRRSTDAKEFVRKMEDAYKGYKKLAEPAVADGHSSSHASEPAKHGLWNPFSRERHVAPDISQWTMSLSGPKGCSVTADATLAAYWTDKTIALCTAQMLSNAGSSGTLDNGPVFTLPGGENVTWRDVRLTEVFLVASTNKDRFQVRRRTNFSWVDAYTRVCGRS